MNHPQLFDDPTVAPPERPKHWRRKGDRATPSPIGNGPPGETCKTCEHARRIEHHGKGYYKCGLMRQYWTHGGASDIKLRWDACGEWIPKDQRERIRALGQYAIDVLANSEPSDWPTSLHVIADYYEERGHDMGWLRHTANKMTGG